jgi:uncharacterized protein
MPTFEWDRDKSAGNLAKHGISFDEAVTIFEGPVFTLEDDGPYEEPRERSYGLLAGTVVVCVIHTERDGATRIISARKATGRERKNFDAYLAKARG